MAGHVLAGVGEYCYIHDVLRWLAGAVHAADLGTPVEGGEAPWIIDLMARRKGDLGTDLQARLHALAWARWKALSRWNGSATLGSELNRLQKRLREIADRAYLIRNFAVHQASTRGPALTRILPGFAGLVQAAVAHTLRTDPTDANVLAEALHANTIVRTLSANLAAGRVKTPSAVQPFLPSQSPRRARQVRTPT